MTDREEEMRLIHELSKNMDKTVYIESLGGDITYEDYMEIIYASVMKEGNSPNSTWREVFEEQGLHKDISIQEAEIDNNPYFEHMKLTSRYFKPNNQFNKS